MSEVLSVKNLNKKFGKKQVLFDVSFDIEEGEILGFIGPNGAGKTTTIKLILGLQSINSGEVYINGIDMKRDFVKAIEKVGAIVESPDMYMYLSGRKNLELVARMYENVDEERIDEVIKITGLENRINDKVSKYSLGMRQRLGIAAALINRPNLLILDEPTNGLDPEGIKELRDLMVDLAKKEKIAILISSHNLAELESFCTDVCIIKNGKIITTSSMKKMKRGETTSYLIEVSNIEKALKVDKKLSKEDDTHIKITCDKKEISEIIKKLIKEVDIYEVRLFEKSLEEAFFEKAGGNIID